MRNKLGARCGLTAVFLSLFVGCVVAGGAVASAQTADPTVARLSLVQGNVAIQRGDTHQNVAGTVNAPLLAGDAISTGAGAEAEIQFDGTTMVRAGSHAQFRFASMEPANRVVQLAEGTIDLDLLSNSGSSPQVDTPSISLRATEAGRYRVTVHSNGETSITVRAGRASILFPNGAQELQPGSTLVVHGSASHPAHYFVDAVAIDSFDTFNAERDQQWLARIGPSDVAYTGIDGDDLDSYGQWVSVPSYGRVWSPYQSPGWAPYRYGQWVWEDGYGWTWVSADPWGWAPYHYGRWFYTVGYGWCWYPPGPGPIWAPALVGFISFGSPYFGIGIGFGSIGWVPLAPWEPYHRWWGHGSGRRYGYRWPQVANITNINNYYGNARHGGFTGTNVRHWQNGDFSHNVAIQPAAFNGMHVQAYHGPMPVAPTTNNLRYSNRALPTSLAEQHFNAGTHFAGATVSVTRTPFATQRSSVVQAISHQPVQNSAALSHQQTTSRFANVPGTGHAAIFPPQSTATANDPWTRFNQSRGLPANARVVNGGGNRSVEVINGSTGSAQRGWGGYVPQAQSNPRYAAPPGAYQQRSYGGSYGGRGGGPAGAPPMARGSSNGGGGQSRGGGRSSGGGGRSGGGRSHGR